MDGFITPERLEALRRTVDERLAALLPDPGEAPHRLNAAMRYALLAPGKRLRPVLTLLTASCLGADESTALDPACAVEMVHAASLVLDDLPCMDDAARRRGQPSTHRRYGEDVAILAAVGLLNQAFSVIAAAPGLEPGASIRMVRALSAAVGMDGLVAGQETDLRREHDLSFAAVSQINERKTAVLFVAAVELGAHAARAGRPQVDALRQFAVGLGHAFQALDDLDDGAVDEEVGQPTLVSVLGREGARAEARRRLEDARSALRAGGARLAPLEHGLEFLVHRA